MDWSFGVTPDVRDVLILQNRAIQIISYSGRIDYCKPIEGTGHYDRVREPVCV